MAAALAAVFPWSAQSCSSDLPYTEATLRAGDCLFIPQHWVHHVASDGGADGRSVAFNLWWRRPERYEPKDCLDGKAGGYGEAPVPASDCAFETWQDPPPQPNEPACSRERGRRRGAAQTKQEL